QNQQINSLQQAKIELENALNEKTKQLETAQQQNIELNHAKAEAEKKKKEAIDKADSKTGGAASAVGGFLKK
uniref:hypothetical protein n=1 Tax=Helicobacter typhlonius TaxID=76936 RepID=UPI002FE14D99